MPETISSTCPRFHYSVKTAPAFVGWSAAPVVHGDLVLCAGSASPDGPASDVAALYGHDAHTGEKRFQLLLPVEHPSPELVTSPPIVSPSGDLLLGIYARDEWLKIYALGEDGQCKTNRTRKRRS